MNVHATTIRTIHHHSVGSSAMGCAAAASKAAGRCAASWTASHPAREAEQRLQGSVHIVRSAPSKSSESKEITSCHRWLSGRYRGMTGAKAFYCGGTSPMRDSDRP